MSVAKRNRSVGHNLERQLAKKFRELGYEHVVTTRSESRSRDNQGIDLINKDEAVNGRFEFNVQAKSINKHVAYAKLLADIPVVEGVTNVVIHRQTTKHGDRFVETGKYAILNLEDFFKMVKRINDLQARITHLDELALNEGNESDNDG